MAESDIGDLSLSALALQSPRASSSRPGLPTSRDSSSSSTTTTTTPGTPRRQQQRMGRRPGPVRIPSSPSSSALNSPPLPALPLASPPLLRTQRALSRSNSSPGVGRARRAPSHDLSTPSAYAPPSTAALNRWVSSFVCVNFDLDVGPVIEHSHPPRRWGIGVGENIAFSSFPDTSLFSEGRVGWSFKLNDDGDAAPVPTPARDAKGKARAAGDGAAGGKKELFGFVMFVQHRDGTIKRGYFQKSLVILTPLPYPSLFSTLIAYLAPLYFAHGQSVLERACREISSWPDPTPGASLELPFLGETFTVQLPGLDEASQRLRRTPYDHDEPPKLLAPSPAPSSRSGSTLPSAPNDAPPAVPPKGAQAGGSALLAPAPASSGMVRSVSATHSASPPAAACAEASLPSPHNILASLPLTPPVPLFGTALLPALWVLWECLVLAEPVLVLAPDPRTASEVIWWLRDFLRPLPFSGDLRPYFHIHDAAFAQLVNTHQPPAGTVLGATNPFFRTTCAHWPNVVTVGERLETNLPGLGKRAMINPSGGGAAGKSELKEGLKTRRKRVVGKDKALLKRWDSAVGTPLAESTELTDELRFHFSHLTEKFLVPLNRYFGSLIPTDLTPDAHGRLPPLKPFQPTAFLASLRTHGYPLAFRSSLLASGQSETAQGLAFYDAFLRSRGFGVWLAWRCEEAEGELRRRARKEGWTG